jgi:hypothetical protein
MGPAGPQEREVTMSPPNQGREYGLEEPEPRPPLDPSATPPRPRLSTRSCQMKPYRIPEGLQER